jgi:hypothetical protein
MNTSQIKAKLCLRFARIFLFAAVVLIGAAFATGPSWLSLVLAVIGVQMINHAAQELSDRRRYLNRSRTRP